jgi:hypothetical protein
MAKDASGQATGLTGTDRVGSDRNCQSSRAENRHRRGKLASNNVPKIVILIDNTILIG